MDLGKDLRSLIEDVRECDMALLAATQRRGLRGRGESSRSDQRDSGHRGADSHMGKSGADSFMLVTCKGKRPEDLHLGRHGYEVQRCMEREREMDFPFVFVGRTQEVCRGDNELSLPP